MKQSIASDVVIVGAGIAGLSSALYLAEKDPHLRIILLSKDDLPECNTNLAQGGIAIVTDEEKDSFSSHIADTLQAGGGRCDKNVVEAVVREAPERLLDLLRWGVDFDMVGETFDLHREGGHSVHRILHHKDFTGREIHQKLSGRVLQQENIRVLNDVFALDLVIENEECHGIYYYCEGTRQYGYVRANAVVLATGGMGQIFPFTTNSKCATGDGIGMAYRAGVEINALQYYQFHPTALYSPGSQAWLISEAVRGFGAYVVNEKGNRFLFEYDPRGELATRDIVTQAIYQEMETTGAHCVYIDISHLDVDEFAHHFPSIWEGCLMAGVDPATGKIPIVPAAHYQCGGIAVDLHGQTRISRLYAVGECAGTGLHGTNRLASNSLLEALVFGYRSANHILEDVLKKGLHALSISVLNKFVLSTGREEMPQEAIEEKVTYLRKVIIKAYHQRERLDIVEKAYQTLKMERDLLSTAGYLRYNRRTGEYRNMLDCALVLMDSLLEPVVS